MIELDGELWTEAELRRALRRKHCPRCHGCFHVPALTPEQVAELRQVARPGHGGNLAFLAGQYGVSKRTILRYLKEDPKTWSVAA